MSRWLGVVVVAAVLACCCDAVLRSRARVWRRYGTATWLAQPESNGGAGFFSFLKSGEKDFFDDEVRPSSKAAVVPPALKPKPMSLPAKKTSTLVLPKAASKARNVPSVPVPAVPAPPPVRASKTTAKASPAVPAPKPTTTVKAPALKTFSPSPQKQQPSQKQQPPQKQPAAELPEFVRLALAPAVEVYNDVVAIPSKVERKTQETIKSIQDTKDAIVSIPDKVEKKKQEVKKSIDDTIETAKYVASLPGRVADTTSTVVGILQNGRLPFSSSTPLSSKTGSASTSSREGFVESIEGQRGGKAAQQQKQKALTFEDIKEGIYMIGDAVEGTVNLAQATGKGAVSAVQAVQRLPSDLQRLSKSTAAKVGEIKTGIEETAASVAAFGDSVARLPETVEKTVSDTQKSVEEIKGKISSVQSFVQGVGKPAPAPASKPKPKPKPPSDLERFVGAATALGKGTVWGVSKSVEFVSWLTEKKKPSSTSTAVESSTAVPTSTKMPFSDEPPVTVVPTEVVQIESAVSAPVVEVPVSTVAVSVVPSADSSAIAAARKNYSPFKTSKQQQD